MTAPRIDINCDMGESFGAWDKGDDAEMLKKLKVKFFGKLGQCQKE